MRGWRSTRRPRALRLPGVPGTFPEMEPLRAWIDSVEGRKMVVRATMTDSDGNVLSEANGLMIKLLPHQP